MRADVLLARAGDARLGAVEISGLSADTRTLKAGDAFFAMPGAREDGSRFIGDALAKGARLVVGEHAPGNDIPFVEVTDVRLALAQAAARFFAAQPKTIVAVTGTSGKTSVAAFVRQIFATLGRDAASIGTIGVVSRPINVYGSLTTPDPIALHKLLADLAGQGVTHVAMEASSHGLDQRRLDGVRLAAGAFTNLTRDHLDYHPSEEAYFAAKMRLFDALVPEGGGAVVDADTPIAARVIDVCRRRGLRLVTVGQRGDAIRILERRRDGFVTRLTLSAGGVRHAVELPLPGDFQTSNALVAAGLAIGCGEGTGAVFAALAALEGAPGRLERIGEVRGAPAFVDYAHKPDALDKALAALRPFVKGRLIVVFGCGGDRDPGKRPMMGAIAAERADVVIVTDDNPRSEDPAAIRAAILAGAPGALEIGDRAEAIHAAVAMLGPGDALLIAGKGHETGQIVKGTVLPFNDAEATRAALKEAA
jgi:UDP-N-acetylmuramoyl-L-alanyl-D-glutamate--2,6-diaminopimelate ligase